MSLVIYNVVIGIVRDHTNHKTISAHMFLSNHISTHIMVIDLGHQLYHLQTLEIMNET